ncbi:MAG TPA: hypothetical protein VEG08_02020 [Terriglobales bacterium]|nr:hypothetical protein [Terriglobales bacterium]
MRRGSAWIFWSWVAACCLLLFATPAFAGDCSGPDDCGSIPDNGTKAACGGGVLAGCVLYERSRKKKDDEEGEGPSTDDDSLFGGGGGQDTPQPPKKADADEGTGTSAEDASLFGGGGTPGGGGAGPASKPPADPGALGE